MIDFALLGCAAFLAGLVDAVVGGGGLIQVPVLFSVFSKELPATLLGTSKFAGIFGTSAAAINYARQVRVAWSAAAPAAAAAFALSFVGAYTVTKVPADFVRTLLPLVLIAVAVYTFRKKDLGSVHAPVHSGNAERYFAVAMGAGIGFYDGFFGPGTGSFLIFLFVLSLSLPGEAILSMVRPHLAKAGMNLSAPVPNWSSWTRPIPAPFLRITGAAATSATNCLKPWPEMRPDT